MKPTAIKHCLLLSVIFISSLLANGQQIVSTELGYQEFTTTISSSAIDEFGNLYYIGSFKGELKVNNQVIATGQGNTDFYVIKMNPAGTILWHKTYGNQESQIGRAIHYLNGALYISYFSFDTLQFGSTLLTPYNTNSGVNGLSKLNASNGNVMWTRRTNLSFSFFGLDADLRLAGASATFIRWDNQLLFDSTGTVRNVFLRLDTASGNIRSSHQITAPGGSLTLQSIEQISPSRIFLCVRTNTASSLLFNNQTITLPSNGGQLLFIKTDTNFVNTTFRLMNPGGTVPFQLGFTRTNLAFSSARDSIYLIANSNSSADNIFYSLDGYNLSLFRRNALIVLDTQFITRRANLISAHPTATNSIQYRSIAFRGNDLFLFGQVAGNNQAPPLISIPQNVITLNFLPGLTDTFNIEGPSRSFVLKTNSTFSNTRIKWLGAHTPYETALLNINQISAGSNLITFGHANDNVWNPWVIDTTLQIVRGQMRANADREETTQAVEYLSDGSLFIAGTGHGKTQLDTSYQGIGLGPNRRDLFMLCRSPNGSILWYKRLFSSFSSANINRIQVQNDKIYILVNLFQPTNSFASNYIKLDTSTIITTQSTQADLRLLITVQRNGASKMILLDDNLPSGKVNSIDIFPNGDIAAVTTMASRGLQVGNLQFPSNTGFYFLRLDSNGIIKNALKIYRNTNPSVGSLPLQSSFIRVNPSDNTLIAGGLYSMLSGQGTHLYLVHNGSNIIDTIYTPNYYPISTEQVRYSMLIKTNLQSILWKSILSPGVGLGGPQSFAQIGSNSYFTYSKSQNGALQANGLTILSDTSQISGILSLNGQGQFRVAKNWKTPTSNNPFNAMRLKSIGNSLYVSGTLNRSTTFDTIAVSVSGFPDALTIKYDTSLIAKQSFRLATPYSESMYDIAIFQDTLYAFAYTAQQTPTFYNNRVYSNPADLEQNAFIGSFTIPKDIVPVEPSSGNFIIYPNPNNGNGFTILSKTGTNLNYVWRIFDAMGRIILQGNQVISAGAPVFFPIQNFLPDGTYFLSLQNPDGKNHEVIRFIVIK